MILILFRVQSFPRNKKKKIIQNKNLERQKRKKSLKDSKTLIWKFLFFFCRSVQQYSTVF